MLCHKAPLTNILTDPLLKDHESLDHNREIKNKNDCDQAHTSKCYINRPSGEHNSSHAPDPRGLVSQCKAQATPHSSSDGVCLGVINNFSDRPDATRNGSQGSVCINFPQMLLHLVLN